MLKKRLIIACVALSAMVMAACGASAPKEEPVPPVELSTGSYEANITELSIAAQPEDFAKLESFTELASLDLSGSSCYDEIMTYASAHPEVEVKYTVVLPVGTVDGDTEELDLSDITHDDVEKYAQLLPYLPGLKTVKLGDDSEERDFYMEDVIAFNEKLPGVFFDYNFLLWDQEHNTGDKELNFSHVLMNDDGLAVRGALRCMPYCSYVDMDSCGISNENMAVIRDENPDKKIVWRVRFGENYSVRTDVEKILASKPSEGGNLEKYNIDGLKYCTEVKYLDIGHNESLGDLSFLAYMPKLEVCIVAMTGATDISAIANCTELEYLEMQTNLPLKDLSPLAGLTNLRHLNIGYLFEVTDLSPVYNLTKLERLMIGALTPIPQEQVDEFCRLVPDCVVDNFTIDPTGGMWRYTGYNEKTWTWTLHPRYELLRKQFGYSDPRSFCFYWNDPLY